jgi:hypothetical protein
MPEKREKRKVPQRPAGLVISPPSPRPIGDDPSLQLFREAKEQAAPTTHHLPTNQAPPTNHPVAPERDFSRVPNSLARVAIPSGLFKGESKKTYDALYQRTRGAIVPRRAARATLAEIMEWAGVSHNTLKAHLKHLSRVGLVRVHYVRGDNTGAEYEVCIPEEVAPPTTHHPQSTHPLPTSQNLAPPTSQNLVLGGGGQVAEESTTSEIPNTLSNTNTERSDDDEAFAALREVERELTGKSSIRWNEVAEVLATELKIAASRTTVSNPDAFFAEHLRRRLFKKDKRQLAAEAGNTAPAPATPQVDASQCESCGGSGWRYKDGDYSKGVEKCPHDKLSKSGEGN